MTSIHVGEIYDIYLRCYLLEPSHPLYRVLPKIQNRDCEDLPVEYLIRKMGEVYEKYADKPLLRIGAMAVWYVNFLGNLEEAEEARYQARVQDFIHEKYHNEFGGLKACWKVFHDIVMLVGCHPKLAYLQMSLDQFLQEVDTLMQFFHDPYLVLLADFWDSFDDETEARRQALGLVEPIP